MRLRRILLFLWLLIGPALTGLGGGLLLHWLWSSSAYLRQIPPSIAVALPSHCIWFLAIWMHFRPEYKLRPLSDRWNLHLKKK